MYIVDTHVHAGLTNYVPVGELLRNMEIVGVEKAVLVQYRAGTLPPGNTDNSYISGCVKQYPDRLAAVCIVDHRKPDALEKLEYWVKKNGMQGVRLEGTDTSPGENKLAIWEKAAELGINISVSGSITPVEDIAHKIPDLNILIEHTGMPKINGERIIKLAEYSNVFVKFTTGGLHAISRQPYPYGDTHSFLRRVFTTFGPERIMWGSDYPPVESREGYSKTLEFIRKLNWISDKDKEMILGGTAIKLWSFR